MRIGAYSPRTELLQKQREIVDEFNHAACLELELSLCSNGKELAEATGELPLDILIYDMEGPRDTELQLLRLAQTMPHCRIVLLSDSERHAMFGYAIHAMGYLTTPIDTEEFLSVLTYLLREAEMRKEQFLPLKVNGVWSQVSANNVIYLESAGHNLLFHLKDGRQLKTTAGLRQYQSLLELNSDYVRCHQSYVVNMNYVKHWTQDSFIMANDAVVNISRPYWQSVRSLYACHVTQMQRETRPVKEKETELHRR